jgi:hypothetical protein
MKSSGSMRQQRGNYPSRNSLDASSPGMPPVFNGKRARPRRFDIFLHAAKTGRLIKALTTDRRVALWRKALFFGSIGALLIVLLFPDALNEVVLSTVFPLVGTVLGIPLDAGFDWVAFALTVVSLLRFFPAELVAEHYRQIFG